MKKREEVAYSDGGRGEGCCIANFVPVMRLTFLGGGKRNVNSRTIFNPFANNGAISSFSM